MPNQREKLTNLDEKKSVTFQLKDRITAEITPSKKKLYERLDEMGYVGEFLINTFFEHIKNIDDITDKNNPWLTKFFEKINLPTNLKPLGKRNITKILKKVKTTSKHFSEEIQDKSEASIIEEIKLVLAPDNSIQLDHQNITLLYLPGSIGILAHTKAEFQKLMNQDVEDIDAAYFTPQNRELLFDGRLFAINKQKADGKPVQDSKLFPVIKHEFWHFLKKMYLSPLTKPTYSIKIHELDVIISKLENNEKLTMEEKKKLSQAKMQRGKKIRAEGRIIDPFAKIIEEHVIDELAAYSFANTFQFETETLLGFKIKNILDNIPEKNSKDKKILGRNFIKILFLLNMANEQEIEPCELTHIFVSSTTLQEVMERLIIYIQP